MEYELNELERERIQLKKTKRRNKEDWLCFVFCEKKEEKKI